MKAKYHSILFLMSFVVALLVSCGGKNNDENSPTRGKMNDELKLEGDKTIYGLACEGCSDSTVVLLPNDGSDPVYYDIIDATQNHKIMGKPKVGDWIGIVLNPEDSTVASLAFLSIFFGKTIFFSYIFILNFNPL
ncbi:MAG: hypothetical protein II416_00180, partial [Prevotella sp.]|nr:hypothetical protein [Prevotella sp.]